MGEGRYAKTREPIKFAMFYLFCLHILMVAKYQFSDQSVKEIYHKRSKIRDVNDIL